MKKGKKINIFSFPFSVPYMVRYYRVRIPSEPRRGGITS